MCDFFGGASSSEKESQSQESSLAKELQSDFGTRFGQQNETMQQLNSVIGRIESGDTGPGFSADEEAARTSQIVNQGAADTRNTEQAIRDTGAGQTFGNNASGQTSAINRQIKERATSNAETNTSNNLIKNTAENYQQGRINAAQTAGGLEALSGIENPEAFASGASSANQGAFSDANAINKEDTSGGLFGSLLTAGVGLAGKAISGGMTGLDTTGGSSPGEQIGNFFRGAVNGGNS